VDRPAQEPAIAVILKRDDTPEPRAKTAAPTVKVKETTPMPAEKDQSAEILKQRDAEIARLTAIVNLSAGHKAHFDTLSKRDQARFLDASDTERDAEIVKAEEANPVVYKSDGGVEYRKADDVRMVEMAKALDAERKARFEAEISVTQAGLEKRAADEMSFLPGETIAKVALLRAVSALDVEDDVKKGAAKILEDANKIASLAFQTVGKSVGAPTGDGGGAQEALDAAVKAAMEKDGDLTRERAMVKVLDTREGAKLYDMVRAEKRQPRRSAV
jgi:hypothetical protein